METNFDNRLKKLSDKLNENDLKICDELISAFGNAMNGHSMSEDIFIESSANIDKTYEKYNSSRDEFFEKLRSLSEEEQNIFYKIVYDYRDFMNSSYILK